MKTAGMSLPFLLLVLIPAFGEDDGEIIRLVDSLRTATEGSREKAVGELVGLGPRALPFVIGRLKNDQTGLDELVRNHVTLLASDSWETREKASSALVALGKTAIPRVEALKNAENPGVRWRLAAVLYRIRQGERAEAEAERLQLTALCEVLASIGNTECADVFSPLLGHEEATVRISVMEAIASLNIVSLADRVSTGLASSDWREQVAASRCLGRLRSTSAVDALASLLRGSSNVHAIEQALLSLAEIGTPPAIKAIAAALRSSDPYIRHEAFVILRHLAGADHGYNPLQPPERQEEAILPFERWANER